MRTGNCLFLWRENCRRRRCSRNAMRVRAFICLRLCMPCPLLVLNCRAVECGIPIVSSMFAQKGLQSEKQREKARARERGKRLSVAARNWGTKLCKGSACILCHVLQPLISFPVFISLSSCCATKRCHTSFLVFLSLAPSFVFLSLTSQAVASCRLSCRTDRQADAGASCDHTHDHRSRSPCFPFFDFVSENTRTILSLSPAAHMAE